MPSSQVILEDVCPFLCWGGWEWLLCPLSISIVSLTSGFSPGSATASPVSAADPQGSKEHGGGNTHTWGDTFTSTSSPISFSSTGKPILVSGNDYPPERRVCLPGGQEEGGFFLGSGIHWVGEPKVDPRFLAS